MKLSENDIKMLLWIDKWDNSRDVWLQTKQSQKQFFRHDQHFYLAIERLNAFHFINGYWTDATYRITIKGRWHAFRITTKT